MFDTAIGFRRPQPCRKAASRRHSPGGYSGHGFSWLGLGNSFEGARQNHRHLLHSGVGEEISKRFDRSIARSSRLERREYFIGMPSHANRVGLAAGWGGLDD